MAIGRISGPMLYSNLERQGVDLAIEGNIVYVDVTNRRLGANTTTPNADLQVVGTANLANISITANTISSDTGIIDFGSNANITISGGFNNYVLSTDGAGNLKWSQISELDQNWGELNFSGNTISIITTDGNLQLQANGTGDIVALNDFYADQIISGNVDAVYFNGDVRGATVVTTGNIEAPYFVGNVRGADIVMDANIASSWYLGNVDATYVNTLGNINAPYFEGNVQAPLITATGNITAPYFIGNVRATDIITSGNIDTPGINGNVNGTYVTATGNVTAAYFIGNITSESSTVSGNVSANLLIGNIFTQQVTSPTGDLHFSAATNSPNNIIRFDSVSAFDIPSGNTAQRPPNPDYGYVRYNTEAGTIEWWGGSSWVSGAQTIQTETINPDGVSAIYTLNQSTTETGILVNVNGTIQQAGSGAYSVAGDQITFSEAPLATDIIEIRYLASGVAALATNFGNIASNVVPYANVTYSLGTTTNRWKDLWLSGSTIYLGDATLSSSNGAIQLPAGSTVGGANVDVNSINANITAANINISTANQNIATINANITATNVAIVTANTGMKTYVDSGIANALFVAGSYGNVVVAEYLYFDPLINSVRANLGVTQIWANANIASTNANVDNINANLGAYQTYANANVTAIQANIGAFYNYANTKIGTNTDSNLVINSTTTSTSNVTGALVVRGGVGISGNLNANGAVKLGQPGTASNVVIAGTTTSSSTTTGALVVKGGIGVAGAVNAGSLTSSSVTTSTAIISTVLGSVVNASTSFSLSTDSVVATSFVGRVVQTNTDTTTDVDLTSYMYPGSSGYQYVTIQVTGQYIANVAAPTTQARLLKAWSAGVWKNDTTGFFTIEGEVLQHAVFNTDATNFPAGAVSAAKVFLTGTGTSSVLLRFTNRTTPAATSATYWSYKVEVQTV